ncbi:MAG: TetR/AcrR family transcriptional regulator [Thermodesulfobacteriota bacterium]|nr:TetR/AcrR family transcriptional regulator [Thermodesulfobacteriota bacterium]
MSMNLSQNFSKAIKLPPTPKGRSTRTTLLKNAHTLFKEKGYYASSISEICHRSNVTMGTSYKYFRNKEEIFSELTHIIIQDFKDKIDRIDLHSVNFEERFRQNFSLLFHYIKKNFHFHKILGESELVDRVTITFYENIVQYYKKYIQEEIRSGNIRKVDSEALTYCLIGIAYFNSFDWLKWKRRWSPEKIIDLLIDFILKGINGPIPFKMSLIPPLPSPIDKFLQPQGESISSKGDQTKNNLFQAAEGVFGHHGFNRASIAEITRRANVGLGTFYIYFNSKKDILEALVRHICHQLRKEIQIAVASLKDRREVERVGILRFFEFAREHQAIYRLIPETEMVNAEVGKWYYQKIAEGYIRGLRKGIEAGQIRKQNPELIAYSLMGLAHFIALRWIVWNPSTRAKVPLKTFNDVMEFILYGLRR